MYSPTDNIIVLIEARFIARTLAAMTSATATRIVCARRRKSEYPGLGTPASSRSLNSSSTSCECGRSKTFFVLSSLSLSLFAITPALLFLSFLSLTSRLPPLLASTMSILPYLTVFMSCVLSLLFGSWVLL